MVCSIEGRRGPLNNDKRVISEAQIYFKPCIQIYYFVIYPSLLPTNTRQIHVQKHPATKQPVALGSIVKYPIHTFAVVRVREKEREKNNQQHSTECNRI